MRIHRSLGRAGLLLVVGVALASALTMRPAPAQADDVRVEIRYGTSEHPFEGQRYQTMRALARYLDERAQHAAGQAIDDAHRGRKDERKFVDSVTQFAEQARDFHRRMDRYQEDPWDVPDEVDDLNEDAHEVSDRIRRARVFEHTWNDWDAVLEVIDQMNRVIAGHDVEATF